MKIEKGELILGKVAEELKTLGIVLNCNPDK